MSEQICTCGHSEDEHYIDGNDCMKCRCREFVDAAHPWVRVSTGALERLGRIVRDAVVRAVTDGRMSRNEAVEVLGLVDRLTASDEGR